jgi:hypothetical protein
VHASVSGNPQRGSQDSSSSESSHSSSHSSPTSSPPVSSSGPVHTGVDPQTGWTTGIWYPNRNFAPLAFRIPLPTIRGPFTNGPNPYRKRGWYWISSQNMQVAISLLTAHTSEFSHSAPSGNQLLVSGGNTGAYAMIWKNLNNHMIDADETVSLGSLQDGWPSAFGGPILQDHTFLINITAPDTPANLVLAEKMLARWSVADTNDGATSHSVNSRWMPIWPLNPVQNSNYASMPYWLKAPGSYQ